LSLSLSLLFHVIASPPKQASKQTSKHDERKKRKCFNI
jgi:hypothetical protein